MESIERHRIICGFTQAEVAKTLGMSKQSYATFEKNHDKVANCPERYRKLADLFGVNVFELVGDRALALLPRTKEERDALLKTIEGLSVWES